MNFINQLSKDLKKRSVYSSSGDNIWRVDLANMQSISKFNKGIRFLLFLLIVLVKIHAFFL